MIVLIGIISALYLFAKESIKNEPLKGHVDSTINSFNNYLSIVKSSRPSLILDGLSNFALRISIYSIFAYILASIVPPIPFKNQVIVFISVVFVLSLLINASIDWHQKHKKSVKELFFNYYLLFLLFFPSIVLMIDNVIKIDCFHNIFQVLFPLIKSDSIIIIQVVWALAVSLFLYVGFWVVSIPIYFSLFASIYLFSFFIRMIARHLNVNVFEGVICVLAFIYTIIEIVK